MKLVFATHNHNKLKEVRAMLPSGFELLSLDDIDCQEEIPETAATIEGNAILKATYIKNKYDYDCFADDTGLEVLALNGAPGVHSARYAGPENDAAMNMQKLLSQLAGSKKRKAQFKTTIALIIGDTITLFTGICEGNILQTPTGENGFGYDPIFQPKGYSDSFAEMTLDQKSKIGHRGKAMRQLIDHLSMGNT